MFHSRVVLWLLPHVWRGRPSANTGSKPLRVARARKRLSSVSVLLARGWRGPKARSLMKILVFFFHFYFKQFKGSQHAIAACVNTYLWDFCFSSASHFIHNSKTLEGGGKRVAWCKGQAAVVGRKNCRLKHILKSRSPEDGRWTLFHPLGSNGVVVSHVRSSSPCFYSRDETSRGLFLFSKTLLLCIIFFVFRFFQMRHHLRFYATEISLWAHNFLSSAFFFFLMGIPVS